VKARSHRPSGVSASGAVRRGPRSAPKTATEVATDSAVDGAPPAPGRGPSASTCEPYRELTRRLALRRNAMAIWQDPAGGGGGVLMVAMVLRRTAEEDRVLREELKGCADYARRVRYRILPGVW